MHNSAPGKMPTIKDVAKYADVSIATVSRVLNKSEKLVNAETMKRVQSAIDELGFYPNPMARGLHRKKTKMIGLILQDINNSINQSIVRGVEDVAQETGHMLILANAQRSKKRTLQYLQTMREKRVDGLILIGRDIVKNVDENKFLENTDMKAVIIGKPYRMDLPAIQINNVLAAREACEYLIGLGHTRIGIITGTKNSRMAKERLKGCQEAFKAHGIVLPDHWIARGKFNFEDGYQAVQQFDEIGGPHGITAIFAHNDMMAIGAMKSLRENGYEIPGDVSIMGFGNVQETFFINPSLSAVALPMYELGVRGMETLDQLLSGKEVEKVVTMPTWLELRESVAAYDGV